MTERKREQERLRLELVQGILPVILELAETIAVRASLAASGPLPSHDRRVQYWVPVFAER